MVTFLLLLPVLNHPLPLELFVHRRLIIGILSLRTFAHLTLLSLSNPFLNLTFSLLPITSSHPHASASDSTFDYWRYINIWLTLTLTLSRCRLTGGVMWWCRSVATLTPSVYSVVGELIGRLCRVALTLVVGRRRRLRWAAACRWQRPSTALDLLRPRHRPLQAPPAPPDIAAAAVRRSVRLSRRSTGRP